jgi:hypothetical protein
VDALAILVVVVAVRVVAHVPMNNRANTHKPNMNFAKLGFLVTGVSF